MKYLLILVLLLPGIIQADSTTVQLHISADALMIRMPSNHWFVLVEDSIPIYDSTHRISHYIPMLTFERIDSIPETDNSRVYIDWTGMETGVSLRRGLDDELTTKGLRIYDDSTKEDK